MDHHLFICLLTFFARVTSVNLRPDLYLFIYFIYFIYSCFCTVSGNISADWNVGTSYSIASFLLSQQMCRRYRRLVQGWVKVQRANFHLLCWQVLPVSENLLCDRGAKASLHMVPARLDLRPSFLNFLPSAPTHRGSRTLTVYRVRHFCMYMECCRLTQRKCACRLVLTQGLSSPWPGQCPTDGLKPASKQHRK